MHGHHIHSDAAGARLPVCCHGLAYALCAWLGGLQHDGRGIDKRGTRNAVKNCQKLPEIFNTDQGSQFTSPEWVGKLEGLGIKVSMDGKGRWMDNVFIERLWRTLKYEDVYLKEYGTLCDLRQGLREWFRRYNTWRTHQALGNRTPEKAYLEDRKEQKEAQAA